MSAASLTPVRSLMINEGQQWVVGGVATLCRVLEKSRSPEGHRTRGGEMQKRLVYKWSGTHRSPGVGHVRYTITRFSQTDFEQKFI
jgi:hypothetical protein